MPTVPTAEKPVLGHDLKVAPRPTKGRPSLPRTQSQPTWPAAATAKVTVGSDTPRSAPKSTDTGLIALAGAPATTAKKTAGTTAPSRSNTPLSGPATVRVMNHATAQRAGINGMVFSLAKASGATGRDARVTVDYSTFAQAYGGSYAARAHLVELPACALTEPGDAACTTATPVAADNDLATHTLTADSVSLPATGPAVLALDAATSSDHGDYKASPLSASSSWTTDLNTGDFSWSYPMATPSVPGNFQPTVSLSYDSSSIDGRTSSTNNQSSWAGNGFNLWSGSISRSYKACTDDGVKNADGTKPGDMCWGDDNATLSLNGHSGELVATGTDSFRLKNDDGTKIDRLHGTSTNVRDNGAHDEEYWRVTTTDGTRYYFGYNRLPNWTSGDPVTNSTWTVPVYGNDSGEPCHADTFAASWCQQAWQWNLDYAVDAHGNAIGYFYTKETNNYARNLTAADETPYDRGGVLDHIEYGLRDSTVNTTKALARVDFTSAERCIKDDGSPCDASTIGDDATGWYDTPWDLNCKAGADCLASASPTFWTRKRLTDVTTSVIKADGSGYNPIDAWHLVQGWDMSDIDYELLLSSITHTGMSATPTVALPPVTFDYDQRTNRLDVPGDDTSPFIKKRLSTIDDEAGGQIDVTYSTATCDASHLPTPSSNTTRCFPVYFTRQGDADPTLQWFNKYVVDKITQTDRTGNAPDMVTQYSYLDGAAWHYDDDDGLTKEKYKTWSTWRGYGHVRVETGGQDPIGMETQADHYFLRGMDGDKGSTTPVTVSDDDGGTITDDNPLAGFEYKTEQYDQPGGVVLGKTVNTPWHHQTASQTHSWGTTTANLTGTASTRAWTSLDNGASTKWRTTHSVNSFEETAGRITQTDDFGDESTSADNRCTRTTYVDNTSAWILTAPARVETVATNCSATPDRSKDVLADVRTAYDGQGYGVAPTTGAATRTATLQTNDGTTATYLESGATYDDYGRALSATDITGTVTAPAGDTEASTVGDVTRTTRTDGRTTTTQYTPVTGFATTVKVTTPPATAGSAATAQTTQTTYDTLRGLPTTVLDPNNKRTDMTYDALGRNLRVWLPNRSKANNDIPNYQYTYTDDDKKPVAVVTKTLKSDSAQQATVALYDGLLRPRQTQEPGPDGGRLVTDTFYDERGLVSRAFASYDNPDPPAPAILTLDDATGVETQTWNSYDGLGRITTSQQVAGNSDGGQVLSTTTTAYGGNSVTVTPPKGASPTTTVTDARGNTTELVQYHGATPTSAADITHYSYTPAGQLHTITDPSGTVWNYGYDQRGNQTSAHDPDKGDSTSVYDDRNQLVSTTDALKQTVTHVYDGLGRETETHQGGATGPLLTAHVWDPSGFKGQLSSATRYVSDGASTLAYTTTYSLYDTLYRPSRTTVTVPKDPVRPDEDPLAGSYQFTTKYNANGTVSSTSYPAAGSLAAEIMTPTYDDIQRPIALSGTNNTDYVTDTVYSPTGKPLQYTYQSGGKKTQVTNTYQWGTQRLDNSRVDREDVPGTDKSSTYGYDEAGDITSIDDVSRDGTDNQCFQYDYLQRLTEAWAQGTGACTTDPSTATLGGPAPYWDSYTYNLNGDRSTDTIHDPAGVTSNDVHHAYTYPTATQAQPHTLTAVDQSGPQGISTDTYTYDADGDTKTRTINGNTQTLQWDVEGHLSQVTSDDGNGGTSTLASYVYDADGNRLISRAEDTTTLYLDGMEVTLDKGAATPKATRYYDLGGGNQAIRTDDGKLSFLISDHLGTAQLAIAAGDLSMQQRRSTPFGTARGSQPTSWPGDEGFVGGTQDQDTGLTHLGARDYDPTTGRFVSTDPLLDPGDPQSLNGYAYADNNPATLSDPSGRQVEECATGVLTNCKKGSPTSSSTYDSSRDRNSDPPSGGCPSTINPACPEYVASTDTSATTTKPQLPTVNLPPEWTQPNHGYGMWGLCWWGIDTALGCVHGKWALKAILDTDLGVLKSISGYDDVVSCSKGNWKGCTWSVVDGIGYLSVAGKAAAVVKDSKALAVVDTLAGCSFSPDTQVLMAHNKKKAIKDIKPGDQVETADPRDGKADGPRTVTARIVNHDNDLVDLKIAGTDGRTVVVHTTSRHPFWDDTKHQWTQAGRLPLGDALNAADGTHARVLAVKPVPGAAAMYNLTVQQLHTYYVLAGTTPILVHNTGCDVPALAAKINPDDLTMTKTVENHFNDITKRGLPARPFMNSTQVVREIMEGSGPVLDPRGAEGALRWDTPGALNGKEGTWELVVDTNTNTILHFNFVR
ncbi:hypothetical protein RVR_7118 [Actinacidiphila reveromycinica]|uniref:Teneurin-like YD-shell domain-containing protein n=2 Tax=Actinacidiphila reveromycinica TaxID=659352 RepID=A0A7U3UWR4_9ACTN|nr:hypothetical protein RVR_7118 [Streptomyces sp. SN-593]